MKKHRFYALLALVLMASIQASGGEVGMQRAKALGAKFVEANFKNVTQLELAYTGVSENGHQAFHVFNGVSGGFLIVSACDLTSPILGYSEQGSFDPNRVPSGLQYFLDGYGQSVDLAEEMLDKADFVIAREWDNLELQGTTRLTKTDVVAPMIATHWNQDCYYNASCPKDVNGPCGSTYAGCVATSMAQVMKYWNYPHQGSGTHSYNCAPYGDLFADFGATEYLWEAMPESLDDNDPNVAVAIYHCGVSVDMYYGAYGSGALHQNIPSALTNYFGYAPAHNRLRDDYTYDQWESMIHEALDLGVPILYGASTADASGHAFVLDGYDANGLIHINWCWGGVLDGYFCIDNFHTYNNYWTVAQKMVADARPLEVYNSTPQAPTNFTVQPQSDESYSCTLHWNNPTKTLNNSNLTHIDQIVVKRDGVVVYTEDNVTPGATMQITDEVPHYGLFDYQVYAVNDGIHGLMASQTEVRFGPSCTWTVVAGSSSFTGWQGAAIQLINNASQVCANLSANSSSETLHVEVPLGHVSWAWLNGNSTVSDVSFVIKNADNQEVYSFAGTPADLPDGIFLQTNNNCGNITDCGSPIELYAFAEDDHVVLDWFDSAEAGYYNVYRDGTLLVTVSGPETGFIDESPNYGGNCYYVTAFCEGGESDPTNEACATVGEGCNPARRLWFEMTSSNKVKLTWEAPQPNTGLSAYYVFRAKESDMVWEQVKIAGSSAVTTVDNTDMEDETTYLYKLVAYYQSIDCYSAPAQSRYNEFEYFVRVHWSVDGVAEAGEKGIEVYPNPAKDRLRIDGIEPAEVQVYNAFGQLVKTVQNANQINVSDLAEGIYLLRITATDGKCHANRVAVRK